jgi:hypothetical protein
MYIDKGILEAFTNVTIGFHHCIKSRPSAHVFYNNDKALSQTSFPGSYTWSRGKLSLCTRLPSFSPFVNMFQWFAKAIYKPQLWCWARLCSEQDQMNLEQCWLVIGLYHGIGGSPSAQIFIIIMIKPYYQPRFPTLTWGFAGAVVSRQKSSTSHMGATKRNNFGQRPTALWVRFSLWIDSCMWKESVNALSKVVGFLQVLRFPPTRKVDRVG